MIESALISGCSNRSAQPMIKRSNGSVMFLELSERNTISALTSTIWRNPCLSSDRVQSARFVPSLIFPAMSRDEISCKIAQHYFVLASRKKSKSPLRDPDSRFSVGSLNVLSISARLS